MDSNFKLTDTKQQLVKSIKLILLGLLFVLEIIICAQYAASSIVGNRTLRIIFVVSCCFLLAVFEAVDAFAVHKPVTKYVFFGLDSTCLLALCVFTGNTYLYTLYCIVLTQIYISIDSMRENTILFITSCISFVISFVCGRIVDMTSSNTNFRIIDTVGDSFLGLAILGIHFIVTNFLLRFYSKNLQLRSALKEADESKAQLKEVYEELSRTAVYEERNRIAKDIHDNAGHSMTTVIMQTEAAKLLIDTNPEEAKTRIISANMQAKNALEQMRESVHLLAGRAQVRTLKEEVDEIIAQTIDGTELKIRSNVEDIVLGEEEERFVLNSIKECLVNGIRHGKATAFFIEIKREFSCASILISDNGCGLDGDLKEGFGLKGIREKAEALGGRCTFTSETDEGFETTITLPFKGGNND